jgi:hypothetical protein
MRGAQPNEDRLDASRSNSKVCAINRLIFIAMFVWAIESAISPIRAQQVLSTSDLKSIQGKISGTVIELEGLDKEREDLESWRNEFHQRRDVHDSYAPCRYEHGHADQCDWFIREATYLNSERDRIDGRVKDINNRVQVARSRLQPRRHDASHIRDVIRYRASSTTQSLTYVN